MIVSINDKNAIINTQMEATNIKVKEMTRKEFCMKLGIFIAIVLLALADVFLGLNKLGVFK